VSEPTVLHVEIRQGLRHARAFNVEPDEVRRSLLEPWSRGEDVRLGDREWAPAESELRILEGVRLAPADLAHGQGWYHAERTGRDVTAAALREAALQVPVAIRAPSASTAAVAETVLARVGARGVAWADVRAGLLGPAATGDARAVVAGALLVVDDGEPDAAWLLDAGLAIGALGARAVVVRLGPAVAADPHGVAWVLDPGDPSSVAALAERLRAVLAAGGSRAPRSR